ncbi:MAG: hypothetical protein Q9164_005000 [Protoblastenia rupestris]
MKVDNALSVRLVTKNIRYATRSPFKGEENWEIRKSYLINELRFHTAHCGESFICLQEVLHQQVVDIHDGLLVDDDWDYIGVGRDDGEKAGEYSPIFFRPSIWKLKEWKTIWLSQTPKKPSRSWDAASTRILTLGVFIHRQSNRKVVALNTHLDDQGSRSRLEGAKIITGMVEEYTGENAEFKIALFLAGDFNSEPHQEAYLEVTGDSSPMVDLYFLVPQNRRYGDSNTFTGFDNETRRKRIDFIFLNQKARLKPPKKPLAAPPASEDPVSSWHADGYAVFPNRFEDGVYNSDHQVVIGDVRIF